MTQIRHGYIDTSSSAGAPVGFDIDSQPLKLIKRWVNSYGNPSYVFYFEDTGSATDIDFLYLVDDFGALNSIYDVTVLTCDRKRDMFDRWHG